MLVLTRKIGEVVVIGYRIRLTVLDVRGQRVALGVDAPADVAILRAELRASPPAAPDGPGCPPRPSAV